MLIPLLTGYITGIIAYHIGKDIVARRKRKRPRDPLDPRNWPAGGRDGHLAPDGCPDEAKPPFTFIWAVWEKEKP